MNYGTFFKEKTDARVARTPQAKRDKGELSGPVFEYRSNLRTIVSPDPRGGPPPGSVDLRGIVYPAEAEEAWGKAARIQDVVTSIQAAEMVLAEVMGKLVAEHLNELWDDAKKEFAARDERLATAEQENATSRAAIAEAQGQIAGLLELQATLEMKFARAVRGANAQLPTITVKPKIRPRRKALGRVAEDAS